MNVHKLNFDTSGNVEDITFVLATKNGDKISNITNVTDIVTKHAMNSYSEFSFNAHKELNRNTLRCWNDIKDFKLMWIPEWDMWFETYVEIDEENEDIKKVTGKSLGEAELSQIMLYNIEINTEADISRDDYKIPTTFYNPDHPEASLVNRLTEKAPHYRFAHIDISLMNIQRTFTFDKKSIYDALKEVAEELNCLFVFGCGSDANGKPERTISVYDLEANCKDCGHRDTFVDKCPKCGSTNVTNGYGEYTNVFISRDNLVEEVTYTTDADSVKNCFKLTAGDDLMTAAIRSCNPNGSDYIYYFSDAVRSDMSEQLQEKLSAYDKLYEEYQKTHNFDIDSSFVNNYNAIVTKYIKYDDSLKKIESPITGYPKLMQTYFDTIDMVQFLKNKLMPNITKPDNSAKSQGEYLMENLPSSAATTSLKNLSVSTANNIMISLAQSIVKGSFKITVTETTLSNDVWRGKFNLKSYSDEDDTYTSSPVSIGINENYEEYVRQRIEKILNKSDDNYYDIVGLFKQDLTVFKSELKKYCLDSLNTFQKCCQSCIDIMVQQGVASDSSTATTSNAINAKAIYDSLYVPYYNKLNAIQDEILVREDEVYTVEGKYNNQNELIQDGVQIEIERIIGDVQDTLNFQKFIGDELNKEFCAFLRMDEYSNDNYISDGLDNTELFQNAFDFINVATKELYKSATLQHSITGTLKNFLRMREFAPIVNSFKNGNWITIQIDDEIYKLRIIEYTIDFASSQNIDVTFSDVISAKDIASDIKSILDQASNMATSYGSIVRQSDMNSNFSKKMSDMILKGLDMTNTKIVSSADNQDITWDEHGLLCREFNDILNDYNPCQLKIINHGLYITNDGWKTAKAGVGQFYYFDPKDKVYKEGYGIIADTLVGNLILSSQVGIYNEEKSIEMDKNGIIVTTNTYNKNVFTIKKEITDDEGNITYERQLYIDDNGNIVLGGGASISWDNVIGTDKDGKSNSMSKLFETLNDTLNEKYNYLLNQDDKKAETWYQSGDPSVDWTTADDKKKHIGDLWYDTKNQKTYIYGAKGWEETKTNPPDSVFDKIDGKAQIFVAQPKSPYAVGDLWFNSATSDIMTCVKARNTIGEFDSTEWEKRNKYTDDSTLTDFINNTYTTDIGNIQDQIDGKIETFRQETDPSKDWTTAEDKKKHIGDLWYNTATNETFMYNGTGWSPVAGTVPDEVWGKIDSKCQIFTAQPKPPYNKGDLWFVGSSGDILTCTTARKDGESYVETDWTKQNKYTDDTTANTIKDGILKSTYIDSQWVIAPNIKGGQLLISNKSGTISAQITSEGKLIAKEGEFSGKIVSTSGEIGGFNIDNYSLWSGQNALGGSGVYISPKYGISCNSSFQVTAGGKLTASDVDISGDVVAQNMFAKDSYKIYASGLGKSIKAIWCGDNWEPDDGYVDLYIGNDSKSWAAFIDKTSSDYKFTRRAIMASQYFNTSNRQNNYSSVNCVTDQDTTYVELTTISKDTPASVRLQIAADSGLCLIPGDVNDSTLTYDESIKLGTKSHKWMQVWTKNLYANGDTVRFSGIPAKSSNRYLVIDSSGNVGYRDGSGGGGSELSQEYAAGTGIKIVNSKISLTGTTKDNNRYVKNPIDGTLHMSNGCGWDLVNRDNKEVTGIYCNGSNQVIISEKDYATILRGSSIQLGNSNTIVSIPYLPNYSSASQYLVADDSGNIGWRSVTQGKTYNLANTSTYGVMCLYSSTGNNTDGTMTQAAITEAINNAGGGGGSSNTLDYSSYSAQWILATDSKSTYLAFRPYAEGRYKSYLGDQSYRWQRLNSKAACDTSSDRTLKDRIIYFDNNESFDKFFMDLKPVSYHLKYEDESEDHYGFIAQDVEKSFNLANIDCDNLGIIRKNKLDKPNQAGLCMEYSLAYEEFIPINIMMTQKAHRRIDELENEIKKLKQIINSLQRVA
ncbi:MAG: tail fiber domain-containing protein [Ruminococcus sp.]|nr:tail fiber domain-containing protein [Ruminococcus sp.]